MAFEIGQRVGDYEIVQLLGVGGMGHVYRVRNVISDRTEAMKVLLPDLTADRDLAMRFISEIRTLASFDHPNIALLHTAFQSGNQLIMMMEFVEGSTLEQRARQGAMSIAEVSGYTYQALSALSYAHSRGVVHRDIKPANLMLTSHGIVKLMDFGIAKSNVDVNLTRPGTTIGSLYYMSPEQVRGDAVDGRSDLYSVGIMLYELLAGRRPFEAETTFSILNQQLNALPQPPIEINPTLPRGLNDIILTALAKDPAQRFPDADAFREALRPFCTNLASEPGHGAIAAPAVAAAGGAAAAIAAVDAASRTAPQPATQRPTPPPFAEVNAPAPPPFANVAPPPSQSFPPSGSSAPAQKSNKALWIATGVAAAILAMVGLAIGVPRLIGTHAAEGAPASGDPSAVTQPVGPVADPGTPVAPTPAATTSPNQGPTIPVLPPAAASNTPSRTPRPAYTGPGSNNTQPNSQPNNQPSTQPENSAPTSNAAELEQAQDRFTEMAARAGAVGSSLDRLRRQQEADGYGLRGDMQSADNRLQAYLRAADSDLRSGNAASASRNLTRAESELNTLEKFLGK